MSFYQSRSAPDRVQQLAPSLMRVQPQHCVGLPPGYPWDGSRGHRELQFRSPYESITHSKEAHCHCNDSSGKSVAGGCRINGVTLAEIIGKIDLANGIDGGADDEKWTATKAGKRRRRRLTKA